jgi:hypothetical protein
VTSIVVWVPYTSGPPNQFNFSPTITLTRSKDPESIEKEARLQQAVAEYQKRWNTSNPVYVRCIAKDFDVPRFSIQSRPKGVRPREKVQELLMNLTNIEEIELIHWITTLTQRGYAPRIVPYENGLKLFDRCQR